MDFGIKNKIALVAASSQGLGKAAALALAQEGVHLAICSRNADSISAAADDIRTLTGVRVLPIAADVTHPEDIDRMFETIHQEFGHVDILVNNAGGPPAGTLSTLSDEDWRRGHELTLMSMVRMTRHVLPMMEQRRWGRIITMVSLAAKEPIDELMISSTVRPGILALSKILANQYGPLGITVNTVCPGYVLTQRQEELSRYRSAEKNISMEEYLKESATKIPIGRLGRPEEIGAVIAFLSSERAGYVNGANLIVDGGQAKAM